MKLRKRSAFIAVILLAFSFAAHGQNFSNYYYDLKLLNPAFAGMKDKHIITTVYSGFPSSGFDGAPRLLYGTYETSIPSIKSGVGAMAYFDRVGVIKTFQGAIFFSRKLEFSERSGLRAGTRLVYRRTKFDYSDLDFQIDDPVINVIGADEPIHNFNLDLGLLYYSDIVNIGVSVTNVLEDDFQDKVMNVIVSREFKVGSNSKISPSVVFMTDFDGAGVLHINSIFEIEKWLLIGGGYVIVEGKDDVTASIGLNINDWVQIVTHVYSASQDKFRDFTHGKVEVMIRANIPHRKAK